MLPAMARPERPGWRTALIVASLVATFLLTAFLALPGLTAAVYHRATAERVVRDWARVAAGELGRRAEAQAGFYGTYPVLLALAAADRLPPPGALAAAAATAEERRNARLVRLTFRYAAAGGGLETSEPLPPDLHNWLRRALAALAAAPPPPGERRPLHGTAGGAERTFVYAVGAAGDRIDGFEVDTGALGPFVALALASGPLLPTSLAAGEITNEALFVRVTARGGGALHRSGGAFDPALGVRLPIADGLLRGISIELSFFPDTARLLVFGGVPRPAAALYLVPLVLAASLLLTAILQLRRERALARLRSEFVASVSHELRTPLTQIRMFAETLLLERVRSPAEGRRSLAVIDQEARRLTHLVENLLQFSRGERGTLRVAPRPLDVAALARATIDAFAPIAAARGVRITAHLPAAAVAAADEDALRQVLLNLLDNAVKYGPSGQEVVVAVETPPGRVRLSVDDQGPGVPPRERRRIFRRFVRLPRERAGAVAGAGIGLAVVAELVALHRGGAWVEEGTRGGARFAVELPAEGAA
jgi:signal transduction histidine kinase